MRLAKAGTLTVAVAVREPFAFQKDGEWTGFDVEVAREIGKEAGLKTEIVKAERERLKQLKDRKVDMVTSVPTAGKRKDGASVTDPYYKYKVQFNVNKEANPNIAKPDDVTSGKVAIPEETQAAAVAEETFDEAVEVEMFPTLEQACAALLTAAFIGLLSDHRCPVSTPEAEKLEATEVEGSAGMGVAEDNVELSEEVESALRTISGSLLDIAKLFGLSSEIVIGGASPSPPDPNKVGMLRFPATINFTSGITWPEGGVKGIGSPGGQRKSCAEWARDVRTQLLVPLPRHGSPEFEGILGSWKQVIITTTVPNYLGPKEYTKVQFAAQLNQDDQNRGSWNNAGDLPETVKVTVKVETNGSGLITVENVPDKNSPPGDPLNGTIRWTCEVS
jgi:hypothetical protein